MISVKAEIEFSQNSKRNEPIFDGYRPAFDTFHKKFKVTGMINIENSDVVRKGEKAIVRITIPVYEEGFINVGAGQHFNFFEANNIIGHGRVLTIDNQG